MNGHNFGKSYTLKLQQNHSDIVILSNSYDSKHALHFFGVHASCL